MWYSKRRRAKSNEDYETWIEGGVCPTLNAFDNTGDSRATVIVFAPGPMVRLGGNIWEGTVPTLRAEAKRGDAEPHLLIIDGTRVDDVRIYEEPVQTLKQRMGTGGNNVPFVAQGEPTMQVRRLTPIECERLMGWPDNHTLHRADGKTNSDTTRYKMCGNGVASPVAQWIAEQINLAENGM
ncbi:S-adenosyl-L-methionine-dependent methyltransferase [uncultured Caudovirales phage]|uniref:S-adenosyl-L-methionine-dependent methyltransferase n=1 Tax=uncultured Caudovirales phage TaxID=2100421 RepID=A0A6J5NBH9_9CAUD|nr:S-adenosyl-L-methionine-dependent methyltransferase [uncultured Caudovirales phage]